jgi:hypothetical protein
MIDRWTERFPTSEPTTEEPKMRILNLLQETEQQDATTRPVAGHHYSANWETCADGTLTRKIIN